jgi:hypothetical protein
MDETLAYLPDDTDKPFTGMVREWYLDRSVVLYRLVGVSIDIVDQWTALVLKTLREWDKTKPYRAIHDLSHGGVSLQFAALVNFSIMNVGVTLEGQSIAEEIFDAHPAFKGWVAINFNLSLSGQTNRTLLNFLQRSHPAVQYKSFYNRNKCIRWVSNDGLSTQELNVSDRTENRNSAQNTD